MLMKSRMERYNDSYSDSNNSIGRRSKNNEDLYKTIYEMSEYSNIEGIASIPKTNAVDVSQVKQMLKSRESYQQEKKYDYLKSSPKESIEEPIESVEEERNYDIRDILNKAKTE